MQRSLLEFSNRDLIDKAIERVKRFVEGHRPRFIYALFSGGKDSTVSTLAALRAARNVIVIYTEVVGNTHQLNVELARRFAHENGMNVYVVDARKRSSFRYWIRATIENALARNDLPCMIHIRAYGSSHGDDYVAALERYGIPYGYRRWCHHEFKAHWWSELPLTKGRNRHLVCGVRASESSHLDLRWLDSEGVITFETSSGTDVALSPIYDFSDADIHAILRRNYPKVLEHYAKYGDSLNCVFCPLRSLEKQRRIVERLRDVPWEAFAKAIERWLERKKPGEDIEKKARKIIEVLTNG